MSDGQSRLHQFTLPPALLQRGFWIYVWKIHRPDRTPTFYIGMTGDTGSYRAQSPMNRVAAHLGNNQRSNALLRYLRGKGITLEACKNLEFGAYGPIGKVPSEPEAYRHARGKIAALEKALWLDLKASGAEMLNDCPTCRVAVVPCEFEPVRAAFTSLVNSK
jgi:hypothetical protein